MKCSVKLLVLISLVISGSTIELDKFYEYVTNKLKDIETYQLPTSNEKLFKTNSSRIYKYGSFDFVIVGAGAAGAVLANRLSEIESWNVLLLEAGGETDDFSDVPLFSNYLSLTDMNWGYLSSPQTTCCQAMENHQCLYPRGKVVGGCTTINAGVYSRGSPSDFNNWAAVGNTGWSYEEILPFFKKSEYVALKSYDKLYHGRNGLLYVNHTYPPTVTPDAFVKANLEKGLKEVDYNGREQLGVSRVQVNQKDYKHQNSGHAFLDPVKNRKNLKIVLHAAVNKIILEKNKVEGVTFIKNGNFYYVTAKKEVILSAGAINTPQLLMLSGIGPKAHLEKLRIPVINNLPAVGNYLQDHPIFFNVYFRTNLSAPNYSLKDNLELYLQGKTPLTNGAGVEHLAFINADAITSGEADIELLTFAPPFSVPKDAKVTFNVEEKFATIFKKYNTFTDISISVALMKPKSKGSVTLKSNSILDFPVIDLNYFSDSKREDLETMYKGIKYILSLAETHAFRNINATFISEQPNCEHLKENDREYWYCALKHMSGTLNHPVGTTRMGPSASDSVVNKDCILHNFNNLRVVDAGVFPEITRGNPMAVVYMVAEKISDSIKERYRKIEINKK